MAIIKKIQLKLLKFAQRLLDYVYEREGLTDKVLELQIELNELRYELDLNDSDEEFLQ